jgi:hypothetical protein
MLKWDKHIQAITLCLIPINKYDKQMWTKKASHHCLCSESETSTSNLLLVPKLPSDGIQNYIQKDMHVIWEIGKKHNIGVQQF